MLSRTTFHSRVIIIITDTEANLFQGEQFLKEFILSFQGGSNDYLVLKKQGKQWALSQLNGNRVLTIKILKCIYKEMKDAGH